MKRALVLLLLTAAAPLDHAARETLAATERAAKAAKQGSADAAVGAVEARQRAAAAASALPALRARAARSRAALRAAERRLTVAEKVQAERRAQIAERQQGAVRMLAALQTMARRPAALALVQPGSAADLAHTRMAVDAVQPQVAAQTAALRSEVTAAEPVRARLKAGRDEEATLALALARDEVALARAEQVARRDAATLASRSVAQAQAAQTYASDAQSLRELVDRIAPAKGGGPVDLRLLVPASGRASLSVGDPMLPQSLSFAPESGAAVIAPAAGRIAFSSVFRSYGGVVILDHGGGWRTILSGLGSVERRVGAVVPTAAVLGRAGEQPVRFELRRGNLAVDPLPYLPEPLASSCRDDPSFAHRSRRAKTTESSRTIPCRVTS